MASEIDPGSRASLKEEQPSSDTFFEAKLKIDQAGEAFRASANVGIQLRTNLPREWFSDKRYRFRKLFKDLFDSTSENAASDSHVYQGVSR